MKYIFFTLASCIAISCTKENTRQSEPSGSKSNSTAVDSLYVGMKYQGGIIFSIDTSGQHGFIAAKADLPYMPWWNGSYVVTDAKGANIGDGLRNTRKIVKAQGITGTYAALACFNYKASGYKDWYLPSQAELAKLIRSHLAPAGAYYWSSTEVDSTHAYMHIEGQTTGMPDTKIFARAVRPIRSF